MPRQTHTAKAALGALGSLYTANAADLPLTAADVEEAEQAPHTGKVLVIAYNAGASPALVTIESVRNSNGRLGPITEYSVGAGEYAVFGPFDLDGWCQANLKLHFSAGSTDIKFGVVDLSNS